MTTADTKDLVRLAAEAAATWPRLTLDSRGFLRHLTERVDGSFEDVHADDLFLAYGCAIGDDDAIAGFMSAHESTLRGVARRFASDGAQLDDLMGILKAHFLVKRAESTPRIADYRGTGPLEGWLRVASVRRLVDDRRANNRRPQEDSSPDRLALALGTNTSWEIDFLKVRYRAAFRHAFEAAVLTLTSEQRNFLRFQTVDGLSLDQIASLHGAHRSSVDRRIQGARRALLSETRAALAASLEAETEEVDSIMRLIRSRLDVSLSRLLRPITAPPPPRSSNQNST